MHRCNLERVHSNMGTMFRSAKPERFTSNGSVRGHACSISAMTVTPGGADCIVQLRDGGASGTIVWTVEADASAGSQSINFNPPIRFSTNCYVAIEGGNNGVVSLAIVEPTT